MQTVVDFIKRFFLDLWHAAFFSALEYDEKLKLTKTPFQRAIIWSIVLGIIILALTVLLMFIWHLLGSINVGEI